MANKGDIIKKYYNEYPQFYVNNNTRLSQLKRTFSSEKKLYREQINHLNHKLKEIQSQHNNELKEIHQNSFIKKTNVLDKYKKIKNEFDCEFDNANDLIKQKFFDEEKLYNEIIDEFESRRQDALSIYLDLVKKNNQEIDKEMQVHHDFINKENSKLENLKTKYDNLNAKLSNKMLWTIEKTKNALTKLNNQLAIDDKDNLIYLNKKIIDSLSELRGTRNNINSLFKTTSEELQGYQETIRKERKTKQKPFENINQEIIQKIVKQIKQANENKIKYQNIIKADLSCSQRKLYPLILKAYQQNQQDSLEKYILQNDIIKKKANFLIEKIEKVTNYNISNYQTKIKEIKTEAFTRNEEIKFTYSVPTQYIVNAINIYSNYNFYFNQGFDDLDKLLTQLIDFIQNFNDAKDNELTITKKEFSNYQTNLIAQINQISENLSNLLYEIDELTYRISTLESKHRLNIAEIKKEIINIDVKGDYKKYLESLRIDLKIANYNYQNRQKKLNILSLYSQKVQDIYKKSSELNKKLEINLLDTELNKIINQNESIAHKDYYDSLINQFNVFYSYQTKLSETFLKIIKLNLLNNTKKVNYYYSKRFYHHKNRLENRISDASNHVIQYIKNSQVKIDINNIQTDSIVGYLNSSKKRYSHLTYIEKSRLELLKKLNENEKIKTSQIFSEIITNYKDKAEQLKSAKTRLSKSIYFFKKQLLLIENNSLTKTIKFNQCNGYYKNVLWIVTQIHYDLINYSYNYHSTTNIMNLNNFYDDFICDFTEKSISIFDRIDSNNTKYIPIFLKEYLIFVIESLEKTLQKYCQIIENISNEKLDIQIKEIAYTKININNHKNIIEKEFDKIAEKSVKIRDNSRKQQENIQKKANKLNFYLEEQVKIINDDFINKKNFTENKISYIKKHIKKQINQNDKKLIKLLKEFDQSIYENQIKLKKDYYLQMKMLNNLKNKIDIDFHSEAKYIESISATYTNKINLTQGQLKTQLDLIPTERQSSLAKLNSEKKSFFKRHQNQLLIKYKEIEKDKFTKIPELETKIKEESSTISEEYQILNEKHIEKEKIYLNKYTMINEKYQETYNNYLKNRTKQDFNVDRLLDQPLKDINDVQSSLISKSNIIFTETENKTNKTILKINEDKQKSENKQKRIINS